MPDIVKKTTTIMNVYEVNIVNWKLIRNIFNDYIFHRKEGMKFFVKPSIRQERELLKINLIKWNNNGNNNINNPSNNRAEEKTR
jgi:hypothetical protein